MQWLFDLTASGRSIAAWQSGGRISPLVSVLTGGRDELKPAAVEALAAVGSAAVPALLGASRRHGGGVPREAGAAMGGMGAPALPVLLAALGAETDRPAVKALAIALGMLKDPRAVKPLIVAAGRVPGEEAIPEALGAIGDWHAAEFLIDAYVTATGDSYRDCAKKALRKIARAVPPDRKALSERISDLLTVRRAGGRKREAEGGSAYAPVTWRTVADSFIAAKDLSAASFRKLQRSLSEFFPEQQHDGWSLVARSLEQMDMGRLSLQCFIQSLACGSDSESDSWTAIRLSPLLSGNRGFEGRLADLPRPRGSGPEPDLSDLAHDLQIRFGFPGAMTDR